MHRIGVLGAGHLGRIHIRLLRELPQYQLCGFYDPDKEKAAQVSAELGVKAYDSMEALMDDVEVVDVVAPTSQHFACAAAAIERGKHVFVEKPLASSLQEAEMLEELAAQYGVCTMVGHVERFNPAYQAAQKVGLEPLFIEGHRLAEFKPRGLDVSVVLDLMIHDLDLVLNLIPYDVQAVYASGVAVVSQHLDIANARLEFANGAVANLTCSRISLKNERKLRLFQPNAYITIDLQHKKVNVFQLKGLAEGEPSTGEYVLDLGEGIGRKEIVFHSPELQESNAISEELKAFAHAIYHRKESPVPFSNGVRAMQLAHRILEEIHSQQLNMKL